MNRQQNKRFERILPFHGEVQLGLSPELNVTDFYNWKELGKGQYGIVWRVRWKKDQKNYYALKVIKKPAKNSKQEELLRMEVALMGSLNHENIVDIKSWFETEKNVYILMEYAEQGDLYGQINKYKCVPEKIALPYLKNLVDALHYLNTFDKTGKEKVLHRDIKGENILITKKGVGKLADFGFANIFKKGQTRDTFGGTIHYVSPEVIDGKPQDPKVDIWAIGILLFELLAGYTPFDPKIKNATEKNFIDNILNKKVEFPSYFSTGAREFINFILKKNPKNRPDIFEVMKHSYWQQNGIVFKSYQEQRVLVTINEESKQASIIDGVEQLTDEQAILMVSKSSSLYVQTLNIDVHEVPIDSNNSLVENSNFSKNKDVCFIDKEGNYSNMSKIEKECIELINQKQHLIKKMENVKNLKKNLENEEKITKSDYYKLLIKKDELKTQINNIDNNVIITRLDKIYREEDLKNLFDEQKISELQFHNSNEGAKAWKNIFEESKEKVFSSKLEQQMLEFKKEELKELTLKNQNSRNEYHRFVERKSKNEEINANLLKKQTTRKIDIEDEIFILKKYINTEQTNSTSSSEINSINHQSEKGSFTSQKDSNSSKTSKGFINDHCQSMQEGIIKNMYMNASNSYSKQQNELDFKQDFLYRVNEQKAGYLQKLDNLEKMKLSEEAQLIELCHKFKSEFKDFELEQKSKNFNEIKKIDEENIEKMMRLNEESRNIDIVQYEKEQQLLELKNLLSFLKNQKKINKFN